MYIDVLCRRVSTESSAIKRVPVWLLRDGCWLLDATDDRFILIKVEDEGFCCHLLYRDGGASNEIASQLEVASAGVHLEVLVRGVI